MTTLIFTVITTLLEVPRNLGSGGVSIGPRGKCWCPALKLCKWKTKKKTDTKLYPIARTKRDSSSQTTLQKKNKSRFSRRLGKYAVIQVLSKLARKI